MEGPMVQQPVRKPRLPGRCTRAQVPEDTPGVQQGLQESVSPDAKGHASRGGRSMRARMCPVKEERWNSCTLLTASSTAVRTTIGGGAHAPIQHCAQVPQPVAS